MMNCITEYCAMSRKTCYSYYGALARMFRITLLLNLHKVNFHKIRGNIKLSCHFLFSTVLNKVFHIIHVYIYKLQTFTDAPEGNCV